MTTQPVELVNRMSAAAYFGYAAELMNLHVPHVTDWSIVARMRRIGLEPGETFIVDSLHPSIRQRWTAQSQPANGPSQRRSRRWGP